MRSWTQFYSVLGMVGLIVPWTMGCTRTLIVSKDLVINTANPIDYHRPPKERNGETVELVILCVTPDDWGKGGNVKLIPDSPLTAADFFKDESAFQGKRKTATIVGKKHDGKDVTTVTGIDFPTGELFDNHSAIWVWAKFKGPDREILPVPAIVFHPPGANTATLRARIRAEEKLEGLQKGQYLEKN